MSTEDLQIQLQAASILHVPFSTYEQDFTFVVNGKEFKTSRLFSDLISAKISEYHMNDPTMNKFIINTKYQGDFSDILKLYNFQSISFSSDKIPFVSEVFKILGNDSISINKSYQSIEINISNVISLLQEHLKYSFLYQKEIEEEINFISSKFYDICMKQRDLLKNLDELTLERIISNPKLQLKNEDQLLLFINDVYKNREEASFLYSYVLFNNVKNSSIHDFLLLFNYDEMTKELWLSICKRLESIETEIEPCRYVEKEDKFITFAPQGEQEFNGIINSIRKKMNNDVESKINITTSSYRKSFPPSRTIEYENKKGEFCTENKPNCWICYEFKENKVNLTHYQIRSYCSEYYCHPKTWVVEGSTDNKKWIILDSQKDCTYLNGKNASHVFAVSNQESMKFSYIRITQTGTNWGGDNFFSMNSVEFYGELF